MAQPNNLTLGYYQPQLGVANPNFKYGLGGLIDTSYNNSGSMTNNVPTSNVEAPVNNYSLGSQVPAYLTREGQSLGFNPINSYNSGANEAGWFGLDANGVSKFSNIMSGIGSGVQAGTSLLGGILEVKNHKMQKEHQDYLKQREAKNDARLAQFAKNAGGTY